MSRIASMTEFWPYYLSEHRVPACRHLHFVGTSTFFAMVVASFVSDPVRFGVCFALACAVAAVGVVTERTRTSFLPMLGIAALLIAGAPLTMTVGIVAAYAMAWIGHFRIEGNRPATFTYPVWSLLSDFRMWGRMVTGRLWTGDSVTAGS